MNGAPTIPQGDQPTLLATHASLHVGPAAPSPAGRAAAAGTPTPMGAGASRGRSEAGPGSAAGGLVAAGLAAARAVAAAGEAAGAVGRAAEAAPAGAADAPRCAHPPGFVSMPPQVYALMTRRQLPFVRLTTDAVQVGSAGVCTVELTPIIGMTGEGPQSGSPCAMAARHPSIRRPTRGSGGNWDEQPTVRDVHNKIGSSGEDGTT
jgi:hypothetical protein